MVIHIQNPNIEAQQRHNGRNIVMFPLLTKQEKLLPPFRKIFNKREYSFFFAFQIIEFLFSSAKECQCSDPCKKSGSCSLELFMIYAYCHNGFEVWDSKELIWPICYMLSLTFWPTMWASSALTITQRTASHRMTEWGGTCTRSLYRNPSPREAK